MARELRLKVAEAKQRDAGRGKARMNDASMRALNITAGSIIELKGKRTTAAVAWPAYQEDSNKDILRIDGLIRKNAGVALNDYIYLRKTEV
jgi:transitional endoplasmic reticulum ATPase